jgi:ERCC4-type nuclease
LRAVADLSGVRPVILIDSREQTPLRFTRLPFRTLREEEGEGLYSGDYSIAGCETLFAVERKSIADLVSCCGPGRERFERELHRLRGFRFARVIVTGPRSDIEASNYRSTMAPRAVLSTVCAFEARYGLPVVFCADETAAAEQVEVWAYWFAREVLETVNDLARAHRGSQTGAPLA